ncbi:aminotransferase class V-fold PLP-dependent enzyme [Schlesneria sp.]|uniref:aminotransferase class V-fold PLP-dependent enzyme n=1 Tax=Schlesneria sp. TaxID=2762018 RepID=UPI002F078DC5
MSITADPAFDVESIRRDFPILAQRLSNDRTLVYLDTAATSQKPRVVIDKMVECFEHFNSNVHRGIHELGDRMTTELENARENVRQFIGAADVDEIVFTSGTTMSLNIVAHGWARKFLKPGDEVLVNAMEHHANLVPWQLAARATGAELKYIPLTDDGRLDLSRLDEVLTSRTRLLAVTAMSNVLGTVNPIAELARRAHDVGALICVDGAQSVPHGHTDVQGAKIDFLAFSGHKLYGPTGIGVLYARRELLEAMDPFLAGGHMIREVFEQSSTWADPPAKFEAGTCPFVEAVAMSTAIDYLRAVGLGRIAQYEHQLSSYAHQRMREIPGIRLLGPSVDHKGAILSFVIEGLHAHDLSDLLDRQGVAIRAGHHCTMPLHDLYGLTSSARASLAFYNTHGEVDKLVEAILGAQKVFQRPKRK